jgi:F-type H+-transporting ATPase subunit epsilon
MELEIATPERQLVREDVSEAQIPAKNGYIGILPGHAPLLSELGAGVLTYVTGGRRRALAIQGGFVEVLPEHIRVLANIAERAEEIDLGRVNTELKRAEEHVLNPALGVDPAAALEALAWAQARSEAAEQK